MGVCMMAPAEVPDSRGAWNEPPERSAQRVTVVKWSARVFAVERFVAVPVRRLSVALAGS